MNRMLTLITIGNLLPWPQYKPSPEQGISTVVVGNPTEESDLCSALMQSWTIQNSCSRILKSQLFHTFWGQMRKDGKITERKKRYIFSCVIYLQSKFKTTVRVYEQYDKYLANCNKNQSSTGSWGVSSALRLIVTTGHSACFTQNSLTVPTKTL